MRKLLLTADAVLLATLTSLASAAGATDAPPQKVIAYVEQQPAPSDDVVVKGEVAVGRAIPEGVEVTPIPQFPQYAYAVVNHERVIVDPRSGTVIKIIR